jgi:hypothetical protein
MAARQKKKRKGRHRASPVEQTSDSGSQTDEEEGLAAGDMGVVFMGDVVLFSPDKKS